jgi:hypothetical protein
MRTTCCHLLVIVGSLLLLIIIDVIGRSMRGSHAKSGQLSRSQRNIGVVNGRVDGHVKELKERLIPLTMNDLLIVVNNLHLLLYHIHALICVTTHGEDAPKHLQKIRVLRGGRDTITAGSVSRSHDWRQR